MTTPEEIELKAFPVTMRGFDQDQVSAFLGRVADEVRALLGGGDEARPGPVAPLPAMQPATDSCDTLGAAVQAILARAQEQADETRARSVEEAQALVAEARREAGQVRAAADAAEQEANRLRDQARAALGDADRYRETARLSLRHAQSR